MNWCSISFAFAHLFVKPDEQKKACSHFAMARKGARKRTKYCTNSYQLILNTYLRKASPPNPLPD